MVKNVFENSKSFWKSKTLWVNGLAFIGALAAWSSGQVEAGVALTFARVVNFALRWVSSQKLQ